MFVRDDGGDEGRQRSFETMEATRDGPCWGRRRETMEETREATRDDGFRNEGRHVREDAPILTLSIHSEFHQEHLYTTIPAKSFVHRWSILVDVI